MKKMTMNKLLNKTKNNRDTDLHVISNLAKWVLYQNKTQVYRLREKRIKEWKTYKLVETYAIWPKRHWRYHTIMNKIVNDIYELFFIS